MPHVVIGLDQDRRTAATKYSSGRTTSAAPPLTDDVMARVRRPPPGARRAATGPVRGRHATYSHPGRYTPDAEARPAVRGPRSRRTRPRRTRAGRCGPPVGEAPPLVGGPGRAGPDHHRRASNSCRPVQHRRPDRSADGPDRGPWRTPWPAPQYGEKGVQQDRQEGEGDGDEVEGVEVPVGVEVVEDRKADDVGRDRQALRHQTPSDLAQLQPPAPWTERVRATKRPRWAASLSARCREPGARMSSSTVNGWPPGVVERAFLRRCRRRLTGPDPAIVGRGRSTLGTR